MRIAVTGATGFLGQSLVRQLSAGGHQLRCWKRATSDVTSLEPLKIDWIEGELGSQSDAEELVRGCDAMVHAALWRPGAGFRGAEGDVVTFAERNVIGSLQLFQAALDAKLQRAVYVSSCSVHEEILKDRPLDETHPLIAQSHYGAHKAAIEAFVHSFARSQKLNISAIRPTGIYGVANPIQSSKWYTLIARIAKNEPVHCTSGGKEVHVDDVSAAIERLLSRDDLCGEVFACYDRYISQMDIARIARELSGSTSEITGESTSPKNQIITDKIRSVGVTFGGEQRLRETIQQLLQSVEQN